MRYYIAAILILSASIPLCAQNNKVNNGKFSFDVNVLPVEDFAGSQSPDSEKISTVLESKYFNMEYEYASQADKTEKLAIIDKFIKHYDAMLKSSSADKAYQRKLATLKAKPMPFMHLEGDGFDNIDKAEMFYKNDYKKVMNRFSDRIMYWRLPYASKDFPEKFNSITRDESTCYRVLSEYYRYINRCIYATLGVHECSYVIGARAQNMLAIADAALAVEDMPVFYAAMRELAKIIDVNVNHGTLKVKFNNAAELGI